MKQSAGLLLYRFQDGMLEFFLVHPGGPFWKNKDEGSWSIPKGEFDNDENPLDAALREFKEETGFDLKFTRLYELKPVKLKSGKLVHAWAMEGDFDPEKIESNHFEMEWPPKSGKKKSFPEIDRGDWFDASDARIKINAAQSPFIDEAVRKILVA